MNTTRTTGAKTNTTATIATMNSKLAYVYNFLARRARAIIKGKQLSYVTTLVIADRDDVQDQT